MEGDRQGTLDKEMHIVISDSKFYEENKDVHVRQWQMDKGDELFSQSDILVHLICYHKIPRLIKRKGIGSFAVMWMSLEAVQQSEVSEKEKNNYPILIHVCRI